MTDFLTNYAIENFWCNPTQSKEAIFELARLTSIEGISNVVSVLYTNIPLPTVGDTYHVFQIGQLSPSIIGLITQDPNWQYVGWSSFSSTINTLPVIVDLYNINGIHIPRFEAYYRFTRTRDLIVAIKQNSNIDVAYGTDAIYIRLYSNSFFNIVNDNIPSTFTSGGTFLNNSALLSFQILYNLYKGMTGATFAFVNGYLVDNIDLINATVGNTVEFIYDPSIKRVLTIPVADLNMFTSILDSVNKYLIHDSLANNDTINYEGDIDIYITNPYAAEKYQGTYYHRNAVDSHRMVTHRDYGIVVTYFVNLAVFLQNNSGKLITDTNNLQLTIYIRKSGFQHSLIFENNRIEELYKLSDVKVIEAMVGLNSTLVNWQATTLENSLYTAIMGQTSRQLNSLEIQNALGYNSYSKITADTPSAVISQSSQLTALVPVGLQSLYTAFEYNANGILLSYENGNPGNTYNVTSPTANLVEMMYGNYSSAPDVYFGTTTVNFATDCNYRVYQSYQLATGLSNGQWSDVTGSANYTVSSTGITWVGVPVGQLLMVRTDRIIIVYSLNLIPINGLLSFTFTEVENLTGTLENFIMPLPMGDLDIFLNGNSLIEDIDYIVNFPVATIINKTALVQAANSVAQNIVVRWSGFCNPDLTHRKASDVGFIANSAFSNTNRYDIMDDVVLRIVVGGKYLSRSELNINDSTAGVSVSGIYNGLPYSVKKPLIPIQNLLSTDLLSFNNISLEIDTSVSEYLGLYLPKLTEAIQSMPSRYPVVSPFICNLIYSLINGEIPSSSITTSMSDIDILTLCKPFEIWLAYDPINVANAIDPRFAVIVPININNTLELPLNFYSFMLRVVGLYCKGLVDLSAYIMLQPL